MGGKIASRQWVRVVRVLLAFVMYFFLQLLYGTTGGPVLSQTDLYLLQTELQISPVLVGRFQFN